MILVKRHKISDTGLPVVEVINTKLGCIVRHYDNKAETDNLWSISSNTLHGQWWDKEKGWVTEFSENIELYK